MLPDRFPEPLLSLLGPSARPTLPHGFPLDLVELPIVRAAHKVSVDAEGNPTADFRSVSGTIPASVRGYRIDYTIESGASGVLPYGRDRKVLYALIYLAIEHYVLYGGRPGRILGVTLQRLAELTGVSSGGSYTRSMRDTLLRLNGVRIRARLYKPELEDGASPRPPRRGGAAPTQEVLAGLITVVWTEDGSTVDYIQIDDIWMQQSAVGWVAWLDLPLYTQMSYTAQRLYDLAAAQCAVGRPEWTIPEETLRQLCGTSMSVPDNAARRDLRKAIVEAVEHGIFTEGTEIIKDGKGRAARWLFRGIPGPALVAARLLRGAGALEPSELRALYALLNAVGLSGDRARELLAASPEDVRWGLLYYCYTRETQPEEQQIRFPAAFIQSAVGQGRNLAGDMAFYRWYQNKTAPATELAPKKEPVPIPAPPEPERVQLDTAQPRAMELWERVREAVLADPAFRQRYGVPLAHLAAARIERGVLVLAYENDLYAKMISSGLPILREAVGAASAGAVEEIETVDVRRLSLGGSVGEELL